MRLAYFPVIIKSKLFQIMLIVLGGIIIAVLTAGIMRMSTVWLFLVPMGLAVVIPSMIVKDVKLYWLAVFLFTLPFSIQKMFIDSQVALKIEETFGRPSGVFPVPILFLSDLLFLVLIFLWFLGIVTKKDKIHFPKSNIYALAFLGWSSLSILGSTFISFGIFQLFQLIKYYLGYLYFANNIKSRKDLKLVIITLMVGVLLQGMACVFQYCLQDVGSIFGNVFGKKEVSESLEHSQAFSVFEGDTSIKRAGGTVGPSNVQAQYFVLSLPLALLLGFASSRKKNRLFYLIIFLSGIMGLIVTFSRGGLVSFLVALCVGILVSFRRRLISKKLMATIIFCSVAGLIIILPLIYSYMKTRPQALSNRLDSYKVGWQLVQSNIFFGVGLNNSTALLSGYDPEGIFIPHNRLHFTIHNWYLVVAGEIGIIGLIFILIFIIKIILEAYRSLDSTDTFVATVAAGILAGLIGICIHMGGDVFRTNTVLVMLWMFAGLAVALKKIDM